MKTPSDLVQYSKRNEAFCRVCHSYVPSIQVLTEGRFTQHSEMEFSSFECIYKTSLWLLNQIGWGFRRDVDSYSFTVQKHIQINSQSWKLLMLKVWL